MLLLLLQLMYTTEAVGLKKNVKTASVELFCLTMILLRTGIDVLISDNFIVILRYIIIA